MAKELSWRKAAEKILADSGEAMHYKDIASQIITAGLRQKIGATPAATVSAVITTSLKNDGDGSPFQRVGSGEYIYKVAGVVNNTQKKEASEGFDEEKQYQIVSSFGMYWQRDLVDWKASPDILGMQQIGAKAVNFRQQLGIYLLYDGREVIYVGRSTQRPIGQRLYEHTADRLATRWDRFSWFGLLPVSDKGGLGKLPDEYSGEMIIPALEAILIEALEPRQNRKRGDDLSVVEYLQVKDPVIHQKQTKSILEAALKKL